MNKKDREPFLQDCDAEGRKIKVGEKLYWAETACTPGGYLIVDHIAHEKSASGDLVKVFNAKGTYMLADELFHHPVRYKPEYKPSCFMSANPERSCDTAFIGCDE